MSTFRDLYNFMQTAKRDSIGYCDPTNDLIFKMHIYNGLHQVNFVKKENDLSVCNITFNDNEVNIYRVVNGIADYSYPMTYKFDSSIDCIPYGNVKGYIERILV